MIELINVQEDEKLPATNVNTEDNNLPKKCVQLSGGPSIEVEALSVTENGTYTAPEGKAYTPVTVEVPDVPAVLETLSVTENGTYTPEQGVDGFNEVNVNIQPPTSEVVVEYDYTLQEYDLIRSVTSGEDKEKYSIYAINNFVYENNGMTAKAYWNPSYTFEQLNDYEIDITFGSFADCSTTNNKAVVCGILNKSPYGISGTVSGGQATVSHCELYYNYSQDKWYVASTITGVSSNTEISGSTGLNYLENRTVKIKIEWKNILNLITNLYELTETITLIDGNNSYVLFKNFMPDTHVVQELFNNENLFIGTYEGGTTSKLENFILKKVKITKIKSNIGGN